MLQSFKLALKGTQGNKIRSFPTMSGIIIGVAAIIILVDLVSGHMGSVVESFASMGVNQINVDMTNLAFRSLDVNQMYVFYEEHTDLFGELSPNVTLSPTIKYGDDSMASMPVTGCSERYLEIKPYELETGRNIAHPDIVPRQKACVIGAYVANELYGSSQNVVGRILKINNYTFKITDVAEVQNMDNTGDGGISDFVWISYSIAVKMSRNTSITNYILTALDTSKAGECTAVIKNFLYETFKDEGLYRVTAMSEILDSLSEQAVIMSGMPGGAARISPSVAGVGVMNVMPVSVTERTREIGIHKSLGADKGTIMRQFVIEATAINSLGGIIGILVGCVATAVVGAAVGVSTTSAPSAVVIPFSVSVGIRLLFGYVPVSRAANPDPIDALRSK